MKESNRVHVYVDEIWSYSNRHISWGWLLNWGYWAKPITHNMFSRAEVQVQTVFWRLSLDCCSIFDWSNALVFNEYLHDFYRLTFLLRIHHDVFGKKIIMVILDLFAKILQEKLPLNTQLCPLHFALEKYILIKSNYIIL